MKKTWIFILLAFVQGVAFSATVETLDETTKSWNNTELPKLNTEKTKITTLRITIAPGEKLPMHKHPVVNVGYLVKGQLQVTTKTGAVQKMKAGESIVEVVDQWHYGENTGKTDAVIVVIYIGDASEKLTIMQ